jgi:RNA-binding protein YlmH
MKGDITADTEEIQGIIRYHFKNLYFKKLDNLNKNDVFLNRCHLSKLNQNQENNLNRPITSKEWK